MSWVIIAIVLDLDQTAHAKYSVNLQPAPSPVNHLVAVILCRLLRLQIESKGELTKDGAGRHHDSLSRTLESQLKTSVEDPISLASSIATIVSPGRNFRIAFELI